MNHTLAGEKSRREPQNQPADDMTNERFEDSDEANLLEASLQGLGAPSGESWVGGRGAEAAQDVQGGQAGAARGELWRPEQER